MHTRFGQLIGPSLGWLGGLCLLGDSDVEAIASAAPAVEGSSPSPSPSGSDGGDVDDLDPNVEARVADDPVTAAPDEGDEDDDDAELPTNPTPEQIQRVNSRRAEKRRRDRDLVRAIRPIVGDRTADQLRAAIAAQQHMGTLQELSRRAKAGDTAAAQQFYDMVSQYIPPPSAGKAPPARGSAPATEFDESALPFNPNDGNPVSRWLADRERAYHKETTELKQTVSQLSAQLRELTTDRRGEVQTRELQSWKGAIDSAADTIKHQGVREVFKDTCAQAYRLAQVEGRRVDPRFVVQSVLKKLGIKGQDAALANKAAAQRVAERNKTLPRAESLGARGVPAPARDRSKDTVESIAKAELGWRGRA